jgi:hypothetical protein
MKVKNALVSIFVIATLLYGAVDIFETDIVHGQGTDQNLTITCNASTQISLLGRQVNWSTSVAGGSGNYIYEWSGSENLSGSSSVVNITHTSPGTKTASVRVTSGSQTNTATCPSIEIVTPKLVGFCSVSAMPNTPGSYTLNWNSYFQTLGSPATTTYSWSGTDNASSSLQFFSQTHTSGGLKTATVRAITNTDNAELTCRADIPDSNFSSSTNRLRASCTPNVSSMTVSWNATGFGGTNGGDPTFSWSGTDGLVGTTSSVVKTYETEGVKQATILVQNGSENITLTCEAKVGNVGAGSGCFIATAAFGTEMEPEVMLLRKFRDENLLTTNIGKKFVDIYYTFSPRVADFIRDKDKLRAVVRTSLKPVILISKFAVEE